MTDKGQIELVYDRECPVCEFYCQRIDIRETAGELQRVDARRDSSLMDDITAAGLDIDAGMVLKVDGELFYGSDAIHQLALLSSRKGFLNRIATGTFRHRRIAEILYPLLAGCRNLLLKILRRSRINNLRIAGKDRF